MFMPAAIIARRMSGPSEDGPTVATIFVRRSMASTVATWPAKAFRRAVKDLRRIAAQIVHGEAL